MGNSRDAKREEIKKMNKRIYDFSDMQMKQLRRLKEQLEGQQTLRNLVALRKEFYKNQKAINYQSEYDRIRRELEKGGPHALPVNPVLEERAKNLKLWGKQLGFNIK